MAIDAKWLGAVAAYSDRVRPQLLKVFRVLVTRPMFASQADWQWPDGDYYVVASDETVARAFPLVRSPHFGARWQAERFANAHNAKSIKNFGPVKNDPPLQVHKVEPVAVKPTKVLAKVGIVSIGATAKPPRSCAYNRGLTMRPKPGKSA